MKKHTSKKTQSDTSLEDKMSTSQAYSSLSSVLKRVGSTEFARIFSARSSNRWVQGFIVFCALSIILVGLVNQDLQNTLFSFLDINTSNAQYSPSQVEKITDTVEKAFVFRVVDGDTFELQNGIRVRMLNMDTPESVKPNTPVQCYALEAKKKLQDMIEQKEVYLAIDKSGQDRYGRELRFVYLREEDATAQNIDQSVNAYMTQQGYARAMIYAPNTTYKQEFTAYQQTAVEQKNGIWGTCPAPFTK